MDDKPLPPLILCMENAAGEDVALKIEPEDDFQSFLIKAKLVYLYGIVKKISYFYMHTCTYGSLDILHIVINIIT